MILNITEKTTRKEIMDSHPIKVCLVLKSFWVHCTLNSDGTYDYIVQRKSNSEVFKTGTIKSLYKFILNEKYELDFFTTDLTVYAQPTTHPKINIWNFCACDVKALLYNGNDTLEIVFNEDTSTFDIKNLNANCGYDYIGRISSEQFEQWFNKYVGRIKIDMIQIHFDTIRFIQLDIVNVVPALMALSRQVALYKMLH